MEDRTLEELRSALLEGLPLEGEAAAVAAFVDALPVQRSTMLRKVKVAAASVVGVLTLTTGLAAADALPGPAQDAAVSALQKVGLDLDDDAPGKSGAHRNDDKANRGGNDDADTNGDGDGESNGKGETISSIAHDPSLEGVEKGGAVCTAASEGQCRANQEHPGTTTTVAGSDDHETPGPTGDVGPPDDKPAGGPADPGERSGGKAQGGPPTTED
jgi:hypothetical protein